jgi:hypothetical protein
MLAITLLLLVLGAVLALFGTAGFALNWAAPDHDSLRFAQILAKSGRRLSAAGLALYALAHYGASGPTLIVLIAVGITAAATYLTATSNTIVPTGATP